jgi:hypothetical protein
MKKLALLGAAFLLFLAGCAAPEPASATVTIVERPLRGTTVPAAAQTAQAATQITQTEQAESNTAAATSAQTAVTTVTESDLPQGKVAILEKYTAVMNKAKRERPSFSKIQYQDAPKTLREADGLATKILEPFIGLLFTAEKDARKNPYNGNDPDEFPVVKSAKGCYITDARRVKSATAQRLPNGLVRLTIILIDQENAQPYWAAGEANGIGGMFDLARKEDFDAALQSMPIENPQYALHYYDCTAALEYDAENERAVRLDQTTYARAIASFSFLGKNNELRFVVVDKTEIRVNDA